MEDNKLKILQDITARIAHNLIDGSCQTGYDFPLGTTKETQEEVKKQLRESGFNVEDVDTPGEHFGYLDKIWITA